MSASASAAPGLPGGTRPQSPSPGNAAPPPPAVVANQLRCAARGYRVAVTSRGIPDRPCGLFPPGDAVLSRLASSPSHRAFEKALPGSASPYEGLPRGGWATGDGAARAGMDLRLFLVGPAEAEGEGAKGEGGVVGGEAAAAPPPGSFCVRGAVRFGDGASIGSGFHLSAHGGAVETCLDEATAELAKCAWTPLVSTVEASFKIKKAVPLHRSLEVRCEIAHVRGLRCLVRGSILDVGEGGERGEGVELATCEATLVDLRRLLAAQQR